MWEKCYELKLGETVKDTNATTMEKLIRVPGGWIYIFGDMEGTTSTFVPFNNEFMTKLSPLGEPLE